jgi:hypothetical protein
MKRRAILRGVLPAALIAGWATWFSPVPIEITQMPGSGLIRELVRKLTGGEFPSDQSGPLALKHVWLLGPLVFVAAILAILPFFLALLYSFPLDRRHMRAWDVVVLVVGASNLILGGWSGSRIVLAHLESGGRLSRDLGLFFFALCLSGVQLLQFVHIVCSEVGSPEPLLSQVCGT